MSGGGGGELSKVRRDGHTGRSQLQLCPEEDLVFLVVKVVVSGELKKKKSKCDQLLTHAEFFPLQPIRSSSSSFFCSGDIFSTVIHLANPPSASSLFVVRLKFQTPIEILLLFRPVRLHELQRHCFWEKSFGLQPWGDEEDTCHPCIHLSLTCNPANLDSLL